MATLLWGGSVLLTLMGALLCWGAHILSLDSLYYDASVCLFLALLLAGLTHV